ncbi:MAG TPA: cobalt ECF transporter T component CbiQ [Methanocella sp.]|nr:cobalt ECF transporter T component CbiQ [Methanocella sp.]
MIPEWMKDAENSPCPYRTASTRKKDFIRKTLDGVFGFFRETMISESYTKRNGLLQSLDPRVKLISIMALVLATSLTRDLRALLLVYLLTLLFAVLSRIEVTFFIKRVWLFIPIFSGIITLPIMFNVFLPGDTLLTLISPGQNAHLGPIGLPASISITHQGLILATTFTLRVAVCVSAVVLLFLTTRQDDLFKSLRSVGVPRVYVMTLAMCYRYIFLFMDMIRDLYLAKKSRTIKSMSTFEEQKWVGGRIGYTMVKSLDVSQRVHQAMLSRGFNGDVKIMHDFKMKHRDYCALVSVIGFSTLLALFSYNIIRI